MKNGISKCSCHSLCSFEVMLCDNGDKSIYDFGKLVLKLLEKSNSKEMTPIAKSSFSVLLAPISLQCITQLFQWLEHHVLVICCCARAYINFYFFCGTTLSKVINEIFQHEEVLIIRTPFHMAMHQEILNHHISNIKILPN